MADKQNPYPLNGLLFAWCEGGDQVSEEEIRRE
jgi:hypothetical protein